MADLTLQQLNLVPCALVLGLHMLSASNVISIIVIVTNNIIIVIVKLMTNIIINNIIMITMEKSHLRSSDSAKWSEALCSLDEMLSNLQHCERLKWK